MRIGARLARLLWRVFALALAALALLGVFLPLVPTVPFLIAAAWAGGRGWPALEHWLLAHPRYGVHIRRWRQGGVVPRRAKWAAISMMAVSGTVLVFFTELPMVLKIAVPLLMAAVAIWLWMRPEQ